MAQNSPSNRTPTEVITSVEQWASHALTQPNDPMRKDVAAVLAMASVYAADLEHPKPSESMAYVKNMRRVCDSARTALSAAGVGGGE